MASITKDRDDASKNIELNQKRVQEMTHKLQTKQSEIDPLKQKLKDAESDLINAREDKKKVAS